MYSMSFCPKKRLPRLVSRALAPPPCSKVVPKCHGFFRVIFDGKNGGNNINEETIIDAFFQCLWGNLWRRRLENIKKSQTVSCRCRSRSHATRSRFCCPRTTKRTAVFHQFFRSKAPPQLENLELSCAQNCWACRKNATGNKTVSMTVVYFLKAPKSWASL